MPAGRTLLCGQLPRPRPRQTVLWTELRQRRPPPLLARQETPTRPPETVLAGGWVGWDGRIWWGPKQAGEVVSSQLFSPRARRILIPWTERQTDRPRIPLYPCLLGSPRALCLSHFGGAVRGCGHRLQVPGKGRPGPCPHIHTEASIYRDTPIQTHTSTHQTCTHAHKYTHAHTNMSRSTGRLCILAWLGEHLWGLQEGGVSPLLQLQALTAPPPPALDWQ